VPPSSTEDGVRTERGRVGTAPAEAVAERLVLRKVAWRLIPFMGLLYLLAFLDRVNIGMAALTMNADLRFYPVVFGTGAGIFFLG
jgi:MFS transporter, ACS family, tartrate transporter